ncbi:hypothetical protein TCAL_13810 [Tigriopus californicus]|uniref:2-oxo-4-hydroxy-4-carboxy-5-ureidoimidazoline decarboxylase n=1 Tax=Tigriopus californicus TaxID=6832 RepID=A0A553PQC8_TIGCA|nr:2-oxo-4-hydroxy-4-carboxy-5-ureidoimidazoline decarboxylase-like [Tigriopus californicus]TRY79887.1 hypothetical protein TCAL_13810 [Tigriopus californicus]|eukprot:TCALIF_13810-PA protein Name:"Similar to urad 2-oxo-4-hydroxy-4-carboxy-5-ureidoimidazoline decarboxylase (Amia calva)" AED:0.04 eAED:0.04 QI:242/1/1/1/0/0/3/111/167
MDHLNQMSKEEFINTFKNVVEYTPETATFLVLHRPFQCVDSIILGVSKYLDQQNGQKLRDILNSHPDLCGRLAMQNKLSIESTSEQSGTGLLGLSPKDQQRISELNAMYRSSFGFPFVICVRLSNFKLIMYELERRLKNSSEVELINGIEQVKKIAALRIRDICAKL